MLHKVELLGDTRNNTFKLLNIVVRQVARKLLLFKKITFSNMFYKLIKHRDLLKNRASFAALSTKVLLVLLSPTKFFQFLIG